MSGIFVDIILFVIIGLFALVGLIRGFFATILSLLGFFGTFIIAFFCSDLVVGLFDSWFGLTPWLEGALGESVASFVAPAIAIIATFVILRILIFILNHTIGKLFKKGILGNLNKSLGVVLGLLQGALIICVVFAILNMIDGIEAVNAFVESTLKDTLITQHVYNWIGELVSGYFAK